jgi:hypothetical protein
MLKLIGMASASDWWLENHNSRYFGVSVQHHSREIIALQTVCFIQRDMYSYMELLVYTV